jgi:hypothetical protein
MAALHADGDQIEPELGVSRDRRDEFGRVAIGTPSTDPVLHVVVDPVRVIPSIPRRSRVVHDALDRPDVHGEPLSGRVEVDVDTVHAPRTRGAVDRDAHVIGNPMAVKATRGCRDQRRRHGEQEKAGEEGKEDTWTHDDTPGEDDLPR